MLYTVYCSCFGSKVKCFGLVNSNRNNTFGENNDYIKTTTICSWFIWVPLYRVNNVREDERVFEVSKFQVLVQKEGNLLNSDTQIHECRGRYSALLSPWISPISWLVKNLDKVRQIA